MELHRLSPGQDPRQMLRRIEGLGWGLLGALIRPAWAFLPASHAWGLGLGGLLAQGNLRWMDLYFARIFRRGTARPRWWHHALYAARFIGLLGGVAAALAWLKVSALGMVAAPSED